MKEVLKTDTGQLVAALKEKKLSAEEICEISDSLRLGLVSSLLKSVSTLDDRVATVSILEKKVLKTIQDKLETDLEADLLDYEALCKLFSMFSKWNIDVTEVKRRIFNGKELLSVDPLDSKDRALLDLMKVVDTEEKRDALRDFISSLNEFDK